MIVAETTTSGGKQLCAKDTGAITASDLSGGSFIISQLAVSMATLLLQLSFSTLPGLKMFSINAEWVSTQL